MVNDKAKATVSAIGGKERAMLGRREGGWPSRGYKSAEGDPPPGVKPGGVHPIGRKSPPPPAMAGNICF